MKKKCLAVLFLVLGIAACNYDVGECYVRGDDGVGGSIIITPTSVGSYGSLPPLETQNAGGYADPCSSQVVECTVTWTAGSEVCKEQGAAGSCTTLYQGQHGSLTEAQDECSRIYGIGAGSGAQSCGECRWATGAANDCKEACKEQCDRAWEGCRERCPKGNQTCFQKCMDVYSGCLRECDKRCK
jgi:hypothetical protein